MPDRIIISDVDVGHADAIKAAISVGYGSDISADVTIYPDDMGPSIAFAQSVGAIAVIHSYAGIENHIGDAQLAYAAIQCFMPLGSNTFEELFNLSSIPVIVPSGAGDTRNDTGYGQGLEFWDDDNDGNPATDGSSYSNGMVLGKLLKIRDTLVCTWWEARYRARQTASNGGVWDKFNGYGKISVAAAIAFIGSIPDDPYLALPGLDVIARLQGVRLVSPALETVSVE